MDSNWKSKVNNFLDDNRNLVLTKDWKELINKARKEGLSGSILYLIGKIFNEDPYGNKYYAIGSLDRTLALRANKGNDIYGVSFVLNNFMIDRPQLTFKTLQDAIKFCDKLIDKGVINISDLVIRVYSDASISDYDYELIETEYGPAYVTTLGIAVNNMRQVNKLYKPDENKLIAELKNFNYTFSDDLVKTISKQNIKIKNSPDDIKLEKPHVNWDRQIHKLKRFIDIIVQFNENDFIDDDNLIYSVDTNNIGFDDETNRKIASMSKQFGYHFNLSEDVFTKYKKPGLYFSLRFERDM